MLVRRVGRGETNVRLDQGNVLRIDLVHLPVTLDDEAAASLFLYFAASYRTKNVKYKCTWTAISRPPWLTALALWPIGDTWGGSGTFIREGQINITEGTEKVTLAPEFSLKKRVKVTHDLQYNWDWKMRRDGWIPTPAYAKKWP